MRFNADLPMWIRDLKPGDRACNCKGEHHVIARIEEEMRHAVPRWVRNAIFFMDYLPGWILGWLPNFEWDIRLAVWVEGQFTKRGWEEVHDRLLTFDDGSRYYARPCCSPDDHEAFDFECQRDL